MAGGNAVSLMPCNFTEAILPAAERTSLLFELCYLYLCGYPELEELIRSRALQARLLFISSETILFKCVCTSDNLVKSLFPILKVAIQKNKGLTAMTYLAKAQGWIDEILKESAEILEKYKSENLALSKTTSDINKKRDEKKKDTDETKNLKSQLKEVETNLNLVREKKRQKQVEVNDAKAKLNSHVQTLANKPNQVVQETYVFFWRVRRTVSHATNQSDLATLRSLEQIYNNHQSEMDAINREEQKLMNDKMDISMKLINLEMKMGSLPSPEYLDEVKTCLSRIQNIMLNIQKFWGFVSTLLKKISDKTFVGNDLIDELEAFKEIILESIADAAHDWTAFGQSCLKAQQAFEAQSKDAYKFLETNPSTLSIEEFQKRCDDVKQKLDEIYPTATIEELPGCDETE